MVNKKAFTLIEILVVFAIIAIFTTLTVVFFNAGKDRTALTRSAYMLAQDIRSVEEIALSGKKLSSGVIPNGYGICLYSHNASTHPNQYIIFGDRNGNNIYDAGDEIIKGPLSLESKIKIYGLVPSTSSHLDIVVVPPDPEININGGGYNNATIILTLGSDTSQKIDIIVNKVGLVEIQ